ncbi:glutamate cyclase domain-containing protein [Anaeroselena agilis]|uniref:DUF4392 domain-containing protein n=1 Tax=Anaeroselena agilis TaxID=3063788 RepID=A0ABU3P0C6_9FIRM|nr:DUF4392 domain-containing protein [Selenomonadales bacterium 4137-cl]
MIPKTQQIAETLDRLISLDVPARGIIAKLYGAAREKTGKPLTLAAADLLIDRVRPGDTVIIATGWVDQPVVAPGCGESDGPPGAVALARALRLALKAAPVIVTDACLVEGVKLVARAAGFQCVAPGEIGHSVARDKLLTLAVLPFPVAGDEAAVAAERLLDDLKPAACIAIERGGMNDAGVIHNMNGEDTGASQAKLDHLFRAAGSRRIATVAVGDGGNEIGMANIADAVRAQVPYGAKCQCPCGRGLAPATPVDVLVAAAISNWGGYAIAALLGLLAGAPAAGPDAAREKRVLEATAAAGFHDPISGGVYPGADGCGADAHLAFVTLVREAVLHGNARL